MKKLILPIMFLFLAQTLNAQLFPLQRTEAAQEQQINQLMQLPQPQKGHLEFLGIPIDGHIDVFTNLLGQKWLSFSKKEDNRAILSGSFAGYDDCKIYVYYSVATDQRAWRVDVEIPASSINPWSSLEADYIYLKDGLTEKYGVPRQKMRQLPFRDRTGNTIYIENDPNPEFETINGKVSLAITNLEKDDNKFGIRLSYIDTENEQKKDKDFMAMLATSLNNALNKDLTYIPTPEIAFLPQPEKGHLEFMGVPIDGNLKAFTGYLQFQSGMQKVKKEGKTNILSGKFAGYKDCKIYVFSYSDDLEVWRTGLEIPSTAFETQEEFEAVYIALNKGLTDIYGAPVNGAFRTENGRIELYNATRNDKGKITACIRLSYTDTENEQKKDAAFKSDL